MCSCGWLNSELKPVRNALGIQRTRFSIRFTEPKISEIPSTPRGLFYQKINRMRPVLLPTRWRRIINMGHIIPTSRFSSTTYTAHSILLTHVNVFYFATSNASSNLRERSRNILPQQVTPLQHAGGTHRLCYVTTMSCVPFARRPSIAAYLREFAHRGRRRFIKYQNGGGFTTTSQKQRDGCKRALSTDSISSA